MAKEDGEANTHLPNRRVTSPTFQTSCESSFVLSERPSHCKGPDQAHSPRKQRMPKHVHIAEPDSRPVPGGSNVYLGSYGKSTGRSPTSLNGTPRDSPQALPTPSPRASLSHQQLERLLLGVDADLDTYGLDELRDGFFDASFYRPLPRDRVAMQRRASETLPSSMRVHRPLYSPKWFLQQWHQLVTITGTVATSRLGVRLLKSFVSFIIAYVMCLVPITRDWLGKYSYISVISVIINHSGRSIGSQVDGALLTTFGTVVGLLWGSAALTAATSTASARMGYGGILATFLILFTAFIAWLRCVFIRFYQAVICAGIAICYTCLADTFEPVGWVKFSQFAIPWTIGQAIALVVCIMFFPAAGTRPVAVSFHTALEAIESALCLPRLETSSLNRNLAWHFVNVSQTVRDFTIDLSISPYSPGDVRQVRNLIQGVLRSVAATKTDTVLFDLAGFPQDFVPNVQEAVGRFTSGYRNHPDELIKDPSRIVSKILASPTSQMIHALKEAVRRIDAGLMDISGYRRYFGPPKEISSNLDEAHIELRAARTAFDEADDSLIAHPDLSMAYSNHPELVELLLFIQPIRQALDKVEALLLQVMAMQQRHPRLRVNPPSYPLSKILLRSNAQVRHDRGGLTAGFYFRSKRELEKAMNDLQSRVFVPFERQSLGRHFPGQSREETSQQEQRDVTSQKSRVGSVDTASENTLRYHAWQILHHLQGFEARFAVKVTIATTLFSIPAWLPQTKVWWNNNECWWVVAMIWVTMAPRVGGNFQDLVTRSSCAVLGAFWGGLSYAAGGGNLYVIVAFALTFMIPMLYRFTLSSHPRSGLIGCLTFTVVSLSEYRNEGGPSVVTIAWTRGFAFVVGVVAAILVNWILWPFLARHELRKSVSTMLLHCAILYRGIVAKYIYYDKDHEPGPKDISKSEMLEGRLREGFVRIRQLMELTEHEMRLRGPFDPIPYSALIDACEHFFARLLDVRQSSLYFQPHMLASYHQSTDNLLTVRRDAVATILINLYILAGALRSDRPVPRYLPSAANARRRLLDRMEYTEAEQEVNGNTADGCSARRWQDVYRYAYSAALTDIVEQLEQLQYYTKEIVGEIGFDIGH